MNKRDLAIKRNDTQREYHTPNCPCKPRERNAIFLNPSNSLEHEMKKCEVCYDLLKEGRQFITEPQNSKGERPDIVVLDTGQIIEIEHRHGNKEELERKGRLVVMTDDAKKKNS